MEITFWHWLIAAACLFGLELLAPGAIMLWLGLAAVASALVAFVAPGIGWELQLILFAVFSLLSIFAWKKFGVMEEKPTDQPHLNRRNERYIGRTFNLVDAIENGVGKVIVDDSQWKVMGEDAPLGTKVKVVGTDGTVLLVETIN